MIYNLYLSFGQLGISGLGSYQPIAGKFMQSTIPYISVPVRTISGLTVH